MFFYQTQNLEVTPNYKSQTHMQNYPAIKIIAGTKCF